MYYNLLIITIMGKNLMNMSKDYIIILYICKYLEQFVYNILLLLLWIYMDGKMDRKLMPLFGGHLKAFWLKMTTRIFNHCVWKQLNPLTSTASLTFILIG